MKIACISTFLKELRQLEKKTKNKYFNCLDDILQEIEGLSAKDLLALGDSLTPQLIPPDIYFRKARIANSLIEGGKSSGYRLIYLVSESDDSVLFLKVYPKRGQYGIPNIGTNEINRLLSAAIEEKGKYIVFDNKLRDFIISEPQMDEF